MEWRILTSSGQLVRGDKQGIGEHSLSVENASGLTPTRLFHRFATPTCWGTATVV